MSRYFEGLVISSCVSKQNMKARVLVWEVWMESEPILKEGEGASWFTDLETPTIH